MIPFVSFHFFFQTAKTEGFFALYKGFIPTFVRLGPWNIIVSFSQCEASLQSSVIYFNFIFNLIHFIFQPSATSYHSSFIFMDQFFPRVLIQTIFSYIFPGLSAGLSAISGVLGQALS